MINKKRVTKITPFFKWFDMWIGVYVDRFHSAVYICLLPTIGIKIWRQDVGYCPNCGAQAQKSAHDTGDGWALMWECLNNTCDKSHDVAGDIEWPFGDAWMSGKDLEMHGFTIV